MCEHYERIGKVCGIIDELERSLTEEEQGLLRQSSHLKYASEKAWGYSRPDWRGIPEGFYAVPDPREGVEEMTYWRRKDAGKQKNPEFKPWQPRGAKVRYGPVGLNAKVLADGVPAALARSRRRNGGSLRSESEPRADVRDDRLGHLRGLREVTQPLETLQHHEEGQGLIFSTGGPAGEIRFTQGRRVESGDLRCGEVAFEARVGGALYRSHVAPGW